MKITGNSVAVLKSYYIERAVMVWETIPQNLFSWEDHVKVKLTTSPLPSRIIIRTLMEHAFIGILESANVIASYFIISKVMYRKVRIAKYILIWTRRDR